MKTRRQLLLGTLSGVGASIVVPGFSAVSFAQQRNTTPPKAVLCIFLRGALDGLSAVVPFSEASYYRDRPRIAIARPGSGPGAGIQLDERFALHPALAAIFPLYRAGELAFVHATGLPESSRSHFDAQHLLEVGTENSISSGEGFLNRALRLRGSGRVPFRAIALGNTIPELLRGSVAALAVEEPEQFGIRAGREEVRDRLEQAFQSLYSQRNDGPFERAGREALEAARTLRAAVQGAQPRNGAVYPRGMIARRLSQAATLLRAGLDVETLTLDVGGWDTHIGQGDGTRGRLFDLFTELAASLAAFRQDLGEELSRVLVLGITEFGRTVAENGSVGTDHGHGSIAFLLGGTLRGGRVFGTWPGLERSQRFEERDLAITTDVRSVLLSVLQHHLGISNARDVFPSASGLQSVPELFRV